MKKQFIPQGVSFVLLKVGLPFPLLLLMTVLGLSPFLHACDDDDLEPSLNAEQQEFALYRDGELTSRKAFWESFAQYCQWYPAKEHCDDGDMTLFNGLLCMSGDERGCQAVKASQSSDGQWWRSPRRINGNLGQGKSFSRDMSMGVLVYLAKTRDTQAAQKWLDWIERNRPCVAKNPFTGGCWIRGLHRYCRDEENQMCTLTPGNWALMGRVWSYLGLPRNSEMKQWEGSDGDITAVEVKYGDPGYELHLKGVGVLLKQYMNVSRAPRQEVAQLLADKQPGNPFFKYLRDGVTDEVVDRVLELCPAPEDGTGFRKYQWSWERADSSEAWRESMGWECIFMHNLIFGLRWSYGGPVPEKHCVQIHEGADPHSWSDNYLCSSSDLGIRWSSAGPIADMRCTRISEASDPNTWNDNYLCVPHSSPLEFTWSSAGPVGGKSCLKLDEPADPHTWDDNYLCW